MKLGLFIGRLNPPHFGHFKIINSALKQNDITLILLGTPLTSNGKNPLNYHERKELLELVYSNTSKLVIKKLSDNASNIKWIKDIKGYIRNIPYNIKELNFYGGDFENDSAYEVFKKYEDMFNEYIINYIEISRNESYIKTGSQKHDLSATNFRKLLDSNNLESAKQFTHKEIFQKIQEFYNKKKS